jgi:hypothetical protein
MAKIEEPVHVCLGHRQAARQISLPEAEGEKKAI